MSSFKRVGLSAILFWIVLSALVCWLYPVMVYDPMARYAPMADAFARGDWFFAYHPRFGVLFTTLAGCISYLTGFSGDRACQIVSIGFLALSALPVWALAKRVWDDDCIAWITVLLVWFATEYFVYAEDGLRDTARIFGLACCALAFVSCSPSPMALGLFVLMTLRTDLFLISGIVLFVWLIYGVARLRTSSRPALSFFLFPFSFFLLGAFLMCFMTRAYTGLWLPGSQFVDIYLKLTGGAS